MLTELNIKRELTPVDGAKRNGHVERKLALITEGARAAWLEFPRHFPDLQFPRKALIWDKIWPEAFSWMNDCINISARVDDKHVMLCPREKLYGRRPTSLVLPFMMPGFRHADRKTKMHSKGERCFCLNTGHDHSSTTHKVLLASEVASYIADVIFGYHRRPFVGESPPWGDGTVVSSPPLPQPPQLMGAGGGAGAVEHQRARPRQQQAAALNGSRGRCRGGGVSACVAAAATATTTVDGSRGRCRSGGVSASAAAVAPAAAALNGSRGRCRGGGASASAVAAATAAAAAFNGSRGRGRGGGDTAAAAVAAAGAGTVGGDRRSGCGDLGDGPVDTGSRKAHRRWNHSRRGVWSGNGGGDIHEGAAGPSGGSVIFARTATVAAVPCDTGGHEIEIESTATGSIKDVYVSCGGGGYRADSRPAGRSLL